MDRTSQLSFAPGDRCCRWLLIGIVALLIDLLLGIAATVLEFQHWGEDGVTPDVIVTCAAIIPQLFVVAAYLVLARESAVRGLWKSTAGMLGSYLLLCLFGLVMLEILPDAGNTGVMIAVGFGLAGLLGFSISSYPRFTEQPVPGSDGDSSFDESESSEGPGWIGGIGIFFVFLVVRIVHRRFIKPILRAGLDIDDWQLIELFLLVVFGVSFAIWFAVTKIRHRRTLGGMAAVTGWIEILILLIHAGMALTIFAILINAAEVDPQLDDDGVDQLLDPWTKKAGLISSGCHVIWVMLTVAFFAAIRRRYFDNRVLGEDAETA